MAIIQTITGKTKQQKKNGTDGGPVLEEQNGNLQRVLVPKAPETKAAGDWQAQNAAGPAQRSDGIGISGISGLSDPTRAGLEQYGQSYTPSQAVTDAQDYLKSVMNSGPGSFQSKYARQIAGLYDQIMNRPQFSYDVNKDPLFQQYKDQYMQQGRRAMQDVMGQAAALTGGYGNSWGSTAGYQAYLYYLQLLNDRIPELEQYAFDKYRYAGEELRKNMDMTNNLDSIDYGRYRDTVADWQASVAAAASAYNTAAQSDLAMWENMQDYYRSLAQMENSNYWNAQDDAYRQAQLAESKRQYDSDLAYQRYKTDLDETYRRDQLAQGQSQWEAEQALAQAKFDLQLRQYEDALAKAAGYGGSGSSGKTADGGTPAVSAQETLVYPVLPQNAAAIQANALAPLSPTAIRGIPQNEWNAMQKEMQETYGRSVQKANQDQAALEALTSANGASGLTGMMLNAALNNTVKKSVENKKQNKKQ